MDQLWTTVEFAVSRESPREILVEVLSFRCGASSTIWNRLAASFPHHANGNALLGMAMEIAVLSKNLKMPNDSVKTCFLWRMCEPAGIFTLLTVHSARPQTFLFFEIEWSIDDGSEISHHWNHCWTHWSSKKIRANEWKNSMWPKMCTNVARNGHAQSEIVFQFWPTEFTISGNWQNALCQHNFQKKQFCHCLACLVSAFNWWCLMWTCWTQNVNFQSVQNPVDFWPWCSLNGLRLFWKAQCFCQSKTTNEQFQCVLTWGLTPIWFFHEPAHDLVTSSKIPNDCVLGLHVSACFEKCGQCSVLIAASFQQMRFQTSLSICLTQTEWCWIACETHCNLLWFVGWHIISLFGGDSKKWWCDVMWIQEVWPFGCVVSSTMLWPTSSDDTSFLSEVPRMRREEVHWLGVFGWWIVMFAVIWGESQHDKTQIYFVGHPLHCVNLRNRRTELLPPSFASKKRKRRNNTVLFGGFFAESWRSRLSKDIKNNHFRRNNSMHVESIETTCSLVQHNCNHFYRGQWYRRSRKLMGGFTTSEKLHVGDACHFEGNLRNFPFQFTLNIYFLILALTFIVLWNSLSRHYYFLFDIQRRWILFVICIDSWFDLAFRKLKLKFMVMLRFANIQHLSQVVGH